jgi:hypothetical protein
MRILFPIDQHAAIRAGLDASRSTMLVEVSPALLTPDAREWVASELDFRTHRLDGLPKVLPSLTPEDAAALINGAVQARLDALFDALFDGGGAQ